MRHKLDYNLIEIVVQHFSFFTPASFLTNLKTIFLECFNTITVTNLLLDQPDRQTDPAGQLKNNIKLHLIDIQEYKKQNFPQSKFGSIHNILLWVYLQSAQHPRVTVDGPPRSVSQS